MTTEHNTPINLKEQNAALMFNITFRDTEHFYMVVKWLNENVGHGRDKWTTGGRVLRRLRASGTITTKVYIFETSIPQESILFLTLI